MQKYYPSFSPIVFFKKLFMTIGFIMFIALGYITVSFAGGPDAAKNTNNVQPELKASVLLMSY